MLSKVLPVMGLLVACSTERASFPGAGTQGDETSSPDAATAASPERDESEDAAAASELDDRAADDSDKSSDAGLDEPSGPENTSAPTADAGQDHSDAGPPEVVTSEPEPTETQSGDAGAQGVTEQNEPDAAPDTADTGTGACENEDTRLGQTACGLNERGALAQSCVQGQWVDSIDACVDDDVCADGNTQLSDIECGKSGYVQQLCVGGQWVNQGSTCIECERTLVFANANLELRLRAYLGVDEPISPLLVENLTALDVGAATIDDLGGVECLKSLVSLNIGVNQITDLSPLGDLPELAYLVAARNQITDLSPLAKLSKLTSLDVSYNPVADISALTNASELLSLWLDYAALDDVSALAGLTKLQTLRMAGNHITDISPLSGLTQLVQLELYSNDISDITALNSMNDLETLSLNSNPVDCDDPNLGALRDRVPYLTTDCP